MEELEGELAVDVEPVATAAARADGGNCCFRPAPIFCTRLVAMHAALRLALAYVRFMATMTSPLVPAR